MRLTNHAVRFVNICHFLREQQQLLLGCQTARLVHPIHLLYGVVELITLAFAVEAELADLQARLGCSANIVVGEDGVVIQGLTPPPCRSPLVSTMHGLSLVKRPARATTERVLTRVLSGSQRQWGPV